MPSDSVTIVTLIIAAIPGSILALLSAIMTVLVFLKQDKMAKMTANTAKTSEITHQLVNGSMLVQLKLHARTARQLADITKNEVNESVAVLAEKELQEHLDKRNTIHIAIENNP